MLSLALPVVTTFNGVLVSARSYRLSVVAGAIALTDPDSMVLVVTVPVSETQVAEVVAKPTAVVQQRGGVVEITVRYADRLLRAVGTAGTPSVIGPPPVGYSEKPAASVPDPGGDGLTEPQILAAAVQRLQGGVQHCGENARRNHWGTEDPRFIKCLCPIALRWRLPKVKESRVSHHVLLKGKNGFSLTVLSTGRVSSCRVWVGAVPPETPVPTVGAPVEVSPGHEEPARAPGDPT